MASTHQPTSRIPPTQAPLPKKPLTKRDLLNLTLSAAENFSKALNEVDRSRKALLSLLQEEPSFEGTVESCYPGILSEARKPQHPQGLITSTTTTSSAPAVPFPSSPLPSSEIKKLFGEENEEEEEEEAESEGPPPRKRSRRLEVLRKEHLSSVQSFREKLPSLEERLTKTITETILRNLPQKQEKKPPTPEQVERRRAAKKAAKEKKKQALLEGKKILEERQKREMPPAEKAPSSSPTEKNSSPMKQDNLTEHLPQGEHS